MSEAKQTQERCFVCGHHRWQIWTVRHYDEQPNRVQVYVSCDECQVSQELHLEQSSMEQLETWDQLRETWSAANAFWKELAECDTPVAVNAAAKKNRRT